MDFKGFTPETFEQLIHALSVQVFGPGVAIFGNGPDGGREATFSGEVNYPSENDSRWNGYGVIQAKYKERIEGRDQEFSWANRQLKSELEAWKTSSKRVPKPHYFVFCTNVELTSASGGGKDKLKALIASYKVDLGLVDFDIWDKDKLNALIDCYSEIRRRFCAFFTTGDLLTSIAESLELGNDVSQALMTYVRNELASENDAKVSQAGDRTGESPSIAEVFVDLPSSSNAKSRDRDGTNSSIPELLTASGYNLDPTSLADESIGKYSSQYVFIGGPGSGKSTIGQFLSQIHRSAILERIPSFKNTNEIQKIIKTVREKCEQEKFDWPKTPRYPFRIDLNQYAKSLAAENLGEGVRTLSQYLRGIISQDQEISHIELLKWFESFPCLLIFDGLDEVPTSANRADVVRTIQSFLGEIRARNADVLVIASSRPDGYRDEFNEAGVCHKYLLPLTKQESLNCAEKYLQCKNSNNTLKVIEETKKLKKALENSLVEKLMQSPLQITFMVTVLDSHGAPSESRWQLFDEYYRTIYTREKQKSVPPFDKVLNERRQTIDVLHYNVGFLLQTQAEIKQSDAELSIAKFTEIVEELLKKDGIEGKELKTELDLIKGAANERLVFLTAKRPGLLSFEVRSLQEYMAAMAITKGDTSEILQRMKAIALSDYWRNTLLFAIGRFFKDSRFFEYRDRIRVFCDDLNQGECFSEAIVTKPGSLLALDILESGTLGNSPAFVRGLTAIALELLDLLPTSMRYFKRLAEICSDAVELQFKQAAKRRLGQTDLSQTYSTWLLYGCLRQSGNTWLDDLARKYWPTKSSEEKIILELLSKYLLSTSEERESLAIHYLSEHPFDIKLMNLTRHLDYDDLLSNLANLVNGIPSRKRKDVQVLNSGFRVRLIGAFDAVDTINIKLIEDSLSSIQAESSSFIHPAWFKVLDFSRFSQSPILESFENSLDIWLNNDDPNLDFLFARRAPWILKYYYYYSREKGEKADLDINNGDFEGFCEKLENTLISRSSNRNDFFESDYMNILVLGRASSASGKSIDDLNFIIENIDRLPRWDLAFSEVWFALAINFNSLNRINSSKLKELMGSFKGKLSFLSIPIPAEYLVNKDDWSSIYSDLVYSCKVGIIHKSQFVVSPNARIDMFTELDWRTYPNIIELVAYIAAAGSFTIDKKFVEEAAPYCKSDVCLLILSLSIATEKSWNREQFTEVMRKSTEDEKLLLLSFLMNNRQSSHLWIKLSYAFLEGLSDHEIRAKTQAQHFHIELISSLPSNV